MTSNSFTFDLTAYLSRIGLDGPPTTAEGLARVQLAQRLAIGFENFDVALGRSIAIDSARVFEKLVVQGRGGYCFEQNRLFSDALDALGLANRPLLARVRLGLVDMVTPPRTHVCLLVTVEGQAWLADAGFGGSNVPPLPLVDGAQERTSDGARHRLRRIADDPALLGDWVLERAGPQRATDGRAAPHEDWQAQYTFDLAQVVPDDLEQANHWTSTRPGTRFTTFCVASIVRPGGFASMVDRQLTVHGPQGAEQREIVDAADYAQTLHTLFRIALGQDDVARLPIFA